MFSSVLQTLRVAIALGLLSVLLSMSLTRLLLWLLPKWGMLDKPDFSRHIHTHAVPRGGGIGMLFAFVIVSALFFGLIDTDDDAPITMLKLLLPLGILMPLGVLDDRFGVRARTKFLFQILAAAVAWYVGFRMERCFSLSLPVWLGFPFTIIWIVGFINAFNMIDGVDGLAAGIGFISALCMVIVAMVNEQYPLAVLFVIFASSLLGFLYFNWHPARLFMGDTGSMFIGYVLAVAGLCLNAQTTSVASIGIPLLACGIPVLDISLAIWRRIIGSPSPSAFSLDSVLSADPSQPHSDSNDVPKESFFMRLAHLVARLGTADQSHIHHRLLRHFQNNQRKTILNIYAMAICLGIVGIGCSFLPNRNLLLAMAIIIGTFSFILNRLAFIELWNSTEMLYHNFQSARTGLIISYAINPLWDLASIVAAYLIAAHSLPIGTACLLRYVAILMLLLCFSRPYRVLWNFAASDDYFRLACTLILGFLLARCSDFLFGFSGIDRLHSNATGIAIALILLERLFIHFFRNAQIQRHIMALEEGEKPERVAICGVNPMARLYRNLLAADIERAAREQIVGLIADDRRFIHSYCFGMKVLGHISNLQAIVREKHISKLVLVSSPSESALADLRSFCQENNLRLTVFGVKETTMDE